MRTERVNTVVVGAGQAGLSVGYHLQRRGVPFVILEGAGRVGDAWRKRWDSLRLFTPRKFSSLDGWAFPGDRNAFPTKDEMGDYLEAYARHFELPIRLSTRVERVSRQGSGFVVVAGEQRFEADNVVVAMANHQRPAVPAFAADLDPSIRQIHSLDYRNPSQLQDGPVLVAGAGNSGVEIALDVVRAHSVTVAGRDTGHVPFHIDKRPALVILMRLTLRLMFHRILSIANPIGRRMRPKMLYGGGPLVRTKPYQLVKAGIERAPRVTGVSGGKPVLADGRVLDVTNVVWATGFHPGFSWIDLPIFGADGLPDHEGGEVAREPGLYFLGLHFLYSMSSEMIHGVGRDAARIASRVAERAARAGASRQARAA
ncbi:MAG TPA: NAD(P)/FAD-dependent oxidoreductase [Vicinamibacterales bacterium]|nr:NAD(P)/FAD-dependent oxidoreductase [Vicinamibacterales bacterium]